MKSFVQALGGNTSFVQTFNTAYPFDVAFQNQFNAENLAVLYIVDSVDQASLDQQIQIAVTQNDQQKYWWKGFGTAPTPSASSFSLAVIVRPGTLQDETGFQAVLQAALTAANIPSVVAPCVVRASDGALIWYCAFQNDITVTPSQPTLTLLLNGVSALPSTGSRSTQIEFQFGNLLLNGTGSALTFRRLVQIDIINHRGESYVPLEFSVDKPLFVQGLTTIANSINLTLSSLLANQGTVPFATTTAIDFCFPYGAAMGDFNSQSIVNAYELASSTDYQVTQTDNGEQIIFTVSFINAIQILNYKFSFINVFATNAGVAMLGVTIRNVAGFWDTTFQLPIMKQNSVLDGQLMLGMANTEGKISTGSRIDFFSAGADGNNMAYVAIEENSGLNIIGTPQKPVTVMGANLNVGGGNLSVNGSITGNTMNIVGAANISGALTTGNTITAAGSFYLNTGVSINFASTIASSNVYIKESGGINLAGDAQHPVSVVGTDLHILNGRVTDKVGYLMPVGSIVAFPNSNIPMGWLPCTGIAIPAQCTDLIALLGSNNTPNLQSRFIVGAGQGAGLSDYNPGQQGGEEMHTLTQAEMPTHSHPINGGNFGLHSRSFEGEHDRDIPFETNASIPLVGTDPSGGNGPHNNLPPYFALIYIIKC